MTIDKNAANVDEDATNADENAAPTTSRGRARRTIGEFLNDEEYEEKLRRLIDSALTLESFTFAHCPGCKQKVEVKIPDSKGRVDSLIKLLQESEGKPQDAEAGGVVIVVERTWPSAGTEDSVDVRPDKDSLAGSVPS